MKSFDMPKSALRSSFSFIPNLFTAGNAFFGFCSIIFAYSGEFITASYCIFLSALMDFLDGRIARMIQAESRVGVEMDSLADAISFCLAPAFLSYIKALKFFGIIGIFISSLFLLSGIFRLARFNVFDHDETLFFTGLPTTVAGSFIALILLNSEFSIDKIWFVLFVAILVIVFSLLMSSSIKFLSFKNKKVMRGSIYFVLPLVLFAIVSVMKIQLILLLFFLLYFAGSVVYNWLID